jgi:hypothetical protein
MKYRILWAASYLEGPLSGLCVAPQDPEEPDSSMFSLATFWFSCTNLQALSSLELPTPKDFQYALYRLTKEEEAAARAEMERYRFEVGTHNIYEKEAVPNRNYAQREGTDEKYDAVFYRNQFTLAPDRKPEKEITGADFFFFTPPTEFES